MNLFNKKYIAKQIAVPPVPDPGRLAAFKEWAADIASGKIASHSEISLRGPFVQKVLIEGLGYRGPIGNQAYDVTQEQSITRGSVDVAIGKFAAGGGQIGASATGWSISSRPATTAGASRTAGWSDRFSSQQK